MRITAAGGWSIAQLGRSLIVTGRAAEVIGEGCFVMQSGCGGRACAELGRIRGHE